MDHLSTDLLADAALRAAAAAIVLMTLVYVVAVIRRNNAIVDVFWGIGILLAGIAAVTVMPQLGQVAPLLVVLVGLWAVRLASHIGLRSIGAEEDWRYGEWRESWGSAWWWRSYLQVFLFQGILQVVMAAPLIFVAAGEPTDIGPLAIVGTFVWAAGLAFEAIADLQLRRHRTNPDRATRFLTTGLWRYSRHPNYFGEAVLWWGIVLVAASVPGAWPAAVSALLVTVLVRFVSGVPPLERRWRDIPEFRAYAWQTRCFVPWRPRVASNVRVTHRDAG